MNERWRVQVTVSAVLDPWMQEYLGGMEVIPGEDEALLQGELEDLAAVYGLFIKLRDAQIPVTVFHAEILK